MTAPGDPPPAPRSPLRWCFEDRASGKIVVAQWPNVPVLVFLAGTALQWLLAPTGKLGAAVEVVTALALTWWGAGRADPRQQSLAALPRCRRARVRGLSLRADAGAADALSEPRRGRCGRLLRRDICEDREAQGAHACGSGEQGATPMSEPYAFGIEEEYFLADAATGASPPERLTDAFHAAAADTIEFAEHELLKGQVEFACKPGTDTAAARNALRAARHSLADVARSHGLALLAAGSHPLGRYLRGRRRPTRSATVSSRSSSGSSRIARCAARCTCTSNFPTARTASSS